MTGVQAPFETGAALPPLRKIMTQDLMTAFEICSTGMMERRTETVNIHTDPELARAAGLGSPIASGMMTTAYLNELLRGTFGADWIRSGHLAITFIGSLRAGDEAVACAVVKGRHEVDGATRLELEVWCENQRGEKVTVGSADLVRRPVSVLAACGGHRSNDAPRARAGAARFWLTSSSAFWGTTNRRSCRLLGPASLQT